MHKLVGLALIIIPLILVCCGAKESKVIKEKNPLIALDSIQKVAFQLGNKILLRDLDAYKDKTVGVVAHHASYVNQSHLVDTLLSNGIEVKAIFAPEHGFRGDADAGENVKDEKDVKTGLPVYSLHGKHKKPSKEQLEGIDVMFFDLQDVGVRFYTYISTLHYVMEACAENGIPLVVLDRPNPNDHYVDGPILKEEFKSFVGMHPVPVVYGMTIGEYATMINGEYWLKDSLQCNLEVIRMTNYWHGKPIYLVIKPSPNLPNMRSIDLYPSLCFFEGTEVSVGRGTDFPFQVFGHPDFKNTYSFKFIPKSKEGAKYPKLEGESCYGVDLRKDTLRSMSKIDIAWLIEAYKASANPQSFFLKNNFINLLAGTSELKDLIIAGKTSEEITRSWEPGLSSFLKVREKYLLY